MNNKKPINIKELENSIQKKLSEAEKIKKEIKENIKYNLYDDSFILL